MSINVLIVGAGPTGLMLACQLARRGVKDILIVDRHAGPARETRALGVQARTLEIYAQLGIVREAIELGKIGTGANLWAQGRKMGRVPLGAAGKTMTPYPYIHILGQDDNERLLGDKLRSLGVDVQWNTELVDLVQGTDGVTVTLRQGSVSRRLTVDWVAGCDGAHSAVRKFTGIGFPGAPYEHVFYVADVEATGAMVPDEVNIYLWRNGFHLLFPMRGTDHWRLVGILPAELRGKDDVSFEDVIPSVQREADLSFKSCSWFSTYRIHHRVAERFREGRCFLLGDAAHIHSPVGAQGMNTGLQDAYNLGWKLAFVVRGDADAALLDTYGEERVPVARRLLNSTDRAFRLVVADNWLAGLFRTQIMANIAAFAMRFEAVQRVAFRTVSQTGIAYRGSSLSAEAGQLPKDAPRPGDRFPWLHLRFGTGDAVEDSFERIADTSFNLILFGQAGPRDTLGFGDRLAVHVVPADPVNDAELKRAGISRRSFYLLRPDGNVGLAGLDWDAAVVKRYLTEKLHLRREPARTVRAAISAVLEDEFEMVDAAR